MNVVTKTFCVLMIDVYIISSEIHMTVFIGVSKLIGTYACIFLCRVVYDCRQNRVT